MRCDSSLTTLGPYLHHGLVHLIQLALHVLGCDIKLTNTAVRISENLSLLANVERLELVQGFLHGRAFAEDTPEGTAHFILAKDTFSRRKRIRGGTAHDLADDLNGSEARSEGAKDGLPLLAKLIKLFILLVNLAKQAFDTAYGRVKKVDEFVLGGV
ncbi:hypothetical protein HG530_011076 [Fusarium avenaceum]|nr:hypothetical protein HG530_011076 [Fusarium avenaceum]